MEATGYWLVRELLVQSAWESVRAWLLWVVAQLRGDREERERE